MLLIHINEYIFFNTFLCIINFYYLFSAGEDVSTEESVTTYMSSIFDLIAKRQGICLTHFFLNFCYFSWKQLRLNLTSYFSSPLTFWLMLLIPCSEVEWCPLNLLVEVIYSISTIKYFWQKLTILRVIMSLRCIVTFPKIKMRIIPYCAVENWSCMYLKTDDIFYLLSNFTSCM